MNRRQNLNSKSSKETGSSPNPPPLSSPHDLEEKFLENENTLEQIFNQSPSFLSVVRGPNHIYERANEKFYEFTGRTDIIGKSVRDLFPEIEAQGFIEILNRVYQTGKAHRGAEVPRTLHSVDGGTQEAFVDFIYQPLKSKNGEVYGILEIGNDVTEKVKARKSLEQSKALIEAERSNLRNLFQQTPEMVCILSGPEHRFEFVNEAHVRALGFDATGKTVREAQPESVEVHGILDGVYQTGKTAKLCEIPVTVGEKLRYFNLTYAARFNPEGQIDGVMILGTEVTEDVLMRERLRQSQERYKLLFDDSPLPKWIFDLETLKFLEVNKAACRHYGYTREEFLSMTIKDIRPPEDAAWIQNEVRRSFPSEQGYLFKSHSHLKKDGTRIDVEVSSHDLILNGRVVRLAVAVDITERVQIEKKQKELLKNLEIAKLEADRASHLKTSFLANMSHEIRTPMTAVLGFTEVLRDMHLTEEERKDAISRIDSSGRALLRLIDDILDISKIEAGKIEIEKKRFSPLETASEVMEILRLQAEHKGLKLKLLTEARFPQTALSDPSRVRQILMNLLGNAIKFTNQGSVQIHLRTEDRKYLVFEMTDTGIGISQENQAKLFHPFAQADGSITRSFGGTGLGLALSRRLCEELGGSLELLESQPGIGSRFVAKIEASPFSNEVLNDSALSETMPTPARRTAKGNALKGVNLLLAEDILDNQVLMRHYLETEGATVDTAANGAEAVEKALHRNYDIVLMDVQMPKMDGIQATEKLRSQGYGKPILALTAHAMPEDELRSLKAGCNGHLTKPIRKTSLIAEICQHLPSTDRPSA